MTSRIHEISPRDDRAQALIEQSHALMIALFPPDENFALNIDALCKPNVRFYAAESDGALLACAALSIETGYGELKSMFVAPEARGLGLAGKLLDHVEREARTLGLPLLRLETGEALKAAVNLYVTRGFSRTGPFGPYTENTSSVFFEKSIH
jgi:putative acetyltransferase